MATNVLQEKITKSGKSFQSFKDVLNNRRVKDIGAAYEFSETLPDIREYLNNAKVSFEFECYLNIGKEFVPTKTAMVSRSKLIYPDVITDPYEMIEMLHEYFDDDRNSAAYERFNLAYREYCKEILKREGLPDEDFEDVYNESEPEWVDKTFSSLKNIIEKFPFRYVNTRWEDYDDLSFLSNEKEKVKEELDVDINDFLNEAYEVAAKRIKQIFGDKVFVDAEGFPSQFKKKYTDSWFLENDSSLEFDPEDYSIMAPIEVITPHWPASVALANMDKFKRMIFKYFDGSTQWLESNIGCHTNITFPEGSRIDLVKLIILSNSQHWAGMMGRANNMYAEPQMDTFLQKIKVTADISKMSLSEFRTLLSKSIKMDKFTDINFLKSNMIEFRFPGNDYFGKLYEQMINTVKWLLYSMTVAITPELFRAEYINRLARLKNKPQYEYTGVDELHAITNTIFYTISDKTIKMPKRFKNLIEMMENNSLKISREMTVKIKEETDNIRDYYGIKYDYITVGEIIQYINSELPEYNFPRYKSIKQKLAIIISVLGYNIFGENK
jgi:hypothetical protein